MTGFLTVYNFTNTNGCRVDYGCSCLLPVSGWFEWLSSGVVGFYNCKSSWCCGLWLRNCVWLWSVGCWPDPCTGQHLTQANTWPPDDWCFWPSSVTRITPVCRQSLRWIRLIQTCVLTGMFSLIIQLVVQYRICPCVTFGLLTILLRSWTSTCSYWLDVIFQ